MTGWLSAKEKQTLLYIARGAIEEAVMGKSLIVLETIQSQPLREKGASFVTLTINGELRGCIGTLEAYQPLAEDVREHAVAAALEDPRFPPVGKSELDRIRIEVSRLTAPVELIYSSSAELPQRLRPHMDGVILKSGARRATFLPQVWEKIPDPEDFLDQLCYKMGVQPGAWRASKMQVFTYQVEEFSE